MRSLQNHVTLLLACLKLQTTVEQKSTAGRVGSCQYIRREYKELKFDRGIYSFAMVGVFQHGLFDGPVTVRTSRQLKRVEKKMFELMDHSVAFYILPETHRCHTENLFQIVRQNSCNIKKVMFVSQNMENEISILDLVLKSAGYNGFSYTCPGCNM